MKPLRTLIMYGCIAACATWIVLIAQDIQAATPSGNMKFDAKEGFPVTLGKNEEIKLKLVRVPSPAYPALTTARAPGLHTVADTWQRRELAKVGEKLEHTFSFRMPFKEQGDTYEMRFELPRGAKVKVSHGTYTANIQRESIEVGGHQQKKVARRGDLSAVRFLEFTLPGGQAFALDLDPEGAVEEWANFDRPPRTARILYNESEEWITLKYVRGTNLYDRGGRIDGKIVFYEGGVTFESVHAIRRNSWTDPLPSSVSLDFGPAGNVRQRTGFTRVGKQRFERSGFGWFSDASGVEVASDGDVPLHGGYVHGSGGEASVFRVPCAPGDYLVTIVSAAQVRDIVSTEVKVVGGASAESIRFERMRKGDFVAKSIVVERCDRGVLDFHFSGTPWQINGIHLQPLRFAAQDFRKRRSWWNHQGPWDSQPAWRPQGLLAP